jgi:hypothetical protein
MSDGLAGLRAKVAKMPEFIAVPDNESDAADYATLIVKWSDGTYTHLHWTDSLSAHTLAEALPAVIERAAGPLLDAAAWVKDHGRHAERCGAYSWENADGSIGRNGCTCGLDAVLAGLESLEGKTRG